MAEENRSGRFQLRVWLDKDLKLRGDAVRPSYISQSGLMAALLERWVEARERGLGIEEAVEQIGAEKETE